MSHMPVKQDRFSRAVQLRNAAQGKRLRRKGDPREYTLHSITNDGHVYLDPVEEAPAGSLRPGQMIVDPSELEVIKG